MASQLDAMIKAVKNTGPKKKYRVQMSENNYYETVVEAIDEDNAAELAREEWNNGNLSSHNSDFEINDINEE